MHVAQAAGSCLEAGCMTELNIRILLCRLNHIGLMSKAVCKYYLASLVRKVHGRILCSLILRDVPLNDNLVIVQAQFFLHLHGAVVMSGCVALVLIAYVDKANL